MKKVLVSISVLLTLAACQGDEPKGKASEVSEPASVTAQATPTKAVPEQVVAALSESVPQLTEKPRAAVIDATMQKMQSEANAKIEAAKVQKQVNSQLANTMPAANTSAQAKSPMLKLEPAPIIQKVPARQAVTETKEVIPAAVKPVAIPVASGDVEKGRMLARKCAVCHNFDTKKKVGPGLAGVFGRRAGSVPGFKYKFTGFIQSGKAWRWDEAHLSAWVCDAKKAVKDFTGDPSAKTKMGVQRICDTTKQVDLIAYLKTL